MPSVSCASDAAPCGVSPRSLPQGEAQPTCWGHFRPERSPFWPTYLFSTALSQFFFNFKNFFPVYEFLPSEDCMCSLRVRGDC